MNGQQQQELNHEAELNHSLNHQSVSQSLNQTNTEGLTEMRRIVGDDEFDSKSGSDNLEGGSGDEALDPNQRPTKKKRYHRHTQHQIQEMEA